MKFTFALFILVSLAFTCQALRRSYEIKVSLVGPNRNEPIQRSSKSTLEIDNDRASLSASNLRVIEHDANDCTNCIYAIEFIPNDKSKTLYTSIKANLVSGRSFEDFLEVAFGEHDNIIDVIGIKYGIVRYLKDGQQGLQTEIHESKVANSQESPDIISNFGVGKAGGPGAGPSNIGGAAPEPPKEEKTFFQKYFWYLIIGGFVVYQFMTFDKEKLMEAANQAQGQAQQRRQQ